MPFYSKAKPAPTERTERAGPWIQTSEGGQFWPLDPRVEDINIKDIARSLANTCRFRGHTKTCSHFYSVAEHSVHVSRLVPAGMELWGLLHDSPEAYTADVPAPLKPFLPGWKAMEDKIMDVVCDKFGLPREEPAEVKAADRAILADERAALLLPSAVKWGHEGQTEPTDANIRCWSPGPAEWAFLYRFSELTGTRVGPRNCS